MSKTEMTAAARLRIGENQFAPSASKVFSFAGMTLIVETMTFTRYWCG
ncbi:MAG TPA: hypothetical protein PKW28_11020 [Turneriella sp.]|nr:hypothetical protein [Turneriella sp.]